MGCSLSARGRADLFNLAAIMTLHLLGVGMEQTARHIIAGSGHYAVHVSQCIFSYKDEEVYTLPVRAVVVVKMVEGQGVGPNLPMRNAKPCTMGPTCR